MSAGETLETELIDTERAAPHTRFPHVEASAFDRTLGDGSWPLSLGLRPARAAGARPLPVNLRTPARQEHAFWQKYSVRAVTAS